MTAAMTVLELNTHLFPRSGNVYDSYAEVLLALGDTTESIINYRRSLALDSTNQNAVEVLLRLGGEDQ